MARSIFLKVLIISGLYNYIRTKHFEKYLIARRLHRPIYITWLEYRFAKQNKIRLRLLFGRIFDDSGRNFRRDPYEIKCNRFVKRYVKNPVIINNLVMARAQRFSNSLMQLCNLLHTAHQMGVKKIFLPESMWFLQKNFMIRDIQFFKMDPENGTPEGISLSGSFFFSKTLQPLIKAPAPSRFDLLSQFKPHLLISGTSNHPVFDLAIHIRSGDIFSLGGRELDYGQPPLAYYLKILNNFSFKSIAIVYEDLANPVIPHVVSHAKKVCKNVSEFSGDLKDDLAILLNVRNVVAGKGTFMQGVVAISDKICNVFCFHGSLKDWGSPVNVIDVVDSSGEFVVNVMSNNWRNSREQIDLMMKYPESALEIKGSLIEVLH